MNRIQLVTIAFLALTLSTARAEVSLKNGNFFKSYTDLVYQGGFDPKLEKIYNSKTDYTAGMFGPGWGTEHEAHCSVSADGSVVLHEWGGGAENRFNPKAFNALELDKAVDLIVVAAKSSGAIGSEEQLGKYRTKLKTDASERNTEWEKYRRAGKLKSRDLAIGTQLHSNKFSYQYITRVQGGYIRTFDNGKTEKYNESCKITKVSDKNGNFIEYTYGKDGKLEKFVDNFNRRMMFKFNTKGRLESVEGLNNQKATYEYDARGYLVKSKDASGNVYTFKYDNTIPVPNMTEIGYSDGTKLLITYFGPEKFYNVKTVKDRDGSLSEYTYKTDTADAGHFTVGVLVKGSDGKKISNSGYEYFMKRKANGEEWQYKMLTQLDDDRTETTYNECCGMPLLIKHNGEETAFEYDVKGHVTKKTTPSEITELAYDPKAGKVSQVKRFSKTDKKAQAAWSQFQYDDKGNLTFAKNSEKKGVKLFYDDVGRIKSMVDHTRRRIDFKYNENSKPVEITDPQLGTITVSYSNSGEIKKVESTAGRKIAMQVTSAFQNLLDIIRPAGVTLSF